MRSTDITDRYEQLLGFVPDGIQRRIDLADKADRTESIEVIEQFRQQLIYQTSSDHKLQQIIHLAMLIALREDKPAALHVVGAIESGASVKELFTLCETAAVVGGMPLFQRAVDLISAGLDADK